MFLLQRVVVEVPQFAQLTSPDFLVVCDLLEEELYLRTGLLLPFILW